MANGLHDQHQKEHMETTKRKASELFRFHIISHHFPNDPIIAEVVASVAEGAVAPMVYELSPVALKI